VVAELVEHLLRLRVPEDDRLVLSTGADEPVVRGETRSFDPVLMSSKSKNKPFVLDPVNLDGLIIRAGQQQFAVVAVVQPSNGSIVGLDREGVSLSIVCPDLDCFVLGTAGELVAQGRELDVGDCVLSKLKSTLCPMYL
jgi:hypothetical protein